MAPISSLDMANSITFDVWGEETKRYATPYEIKKMNEIQLRLDAGEDLTNEERTVEPDWMMKEDKGADKPFWGDVPF